MLPPGMEALTDPCLPDSWNVYGAYASLFAMSAALIMQLIEFIAHQRYQINKDSETYPLFGTKNERYGTREPIDTSESSHHSHGLGFQDDNQNRKISTYLLEFGIALHSVLIGLTLGTTTDSFVPLFIALSFHQFFEAIALGAQIARLDQLPLRSAIFMVLFFTFTTPVGIAVGIGIHSTTYNPKSVASLLVNGILDSVSGGILIYVALVNLITAEMGVGARSFHLLSKKLKLLYFTSLYGGVAAMAVIGRWV
jgi:zinc transporter 1/2/3